MRRLLELVKTVLESDRRAERRRKEALRMLTGVKTVESLLLGRVYEETGDEGARSLSLKRREKAETLRAERDQAAYLRGMGLFGSGR